MGHPFHLIQLKVEAGWQRVVPFQRRQIDNVFLVPIAIQGSICIGD